MSTSLMDGPSPNTRFCFGDRVRITAGFYRGSIGMVTGTFSDSLTRYTVCIRWPWPWSLIYRARREFMREADLELLQ